MSLKLKRAVKRIIIAGVVLSGLLEISVARPPDISTIKLNHGTGW